jgi:hypothetical protein
MPHVIVKLWPGNSEQQKVRLVEKIVKDVMDVLNWGGETISGEPDPEKDPYKAFPAGRMDLPRARELASSRRGPSASFVQHLSCRVAACCLVARRGTRTCKSDHRTPRSSSRIHRTTS